MTPVRRVCCPRRIDCPPLRVTDEQASIVDKDGTRSLRSYPTSAASTCAFWWSFLRIAAYLGARGGRRQETDHTSWDPRGFPRTPSAYAGYR